MFFFHRSSKCLDLASPIRPLDCLLLCMPSVSPHPPPPVEAAFLLPSRLPLSRRSPPNPKSTRHNAWHPSRFPPSTKQCSKRSHLHCPLSALTLPIFISVIPPLLFALSALNPLHFSISSQFSTLCSPLFSLFSLLFASPHPSPFPPLPSPYFAPSSSFPALYFAPSSSFSAICSPAYPLPPIFLVGCRVVV